MGRREGPPSRRSLEEIFAKFKASQGRMDNNQTTDPADGEDFGDNDTIHTQNSSMLEDTSVRDTTHSSMSISEGEGGADIEHMTTRVAELQEVLQGKEAVIESLTAEIDHIRSEACAPNSSQSNNSMQYRDVLLILQSKRQDYEAQIQQRDRLISELIKSLEQTLAQRDELKEKVDYLNPLDSSNQEQLHQEKFL